MDKTFDRKLTSVLKSRALLRFLLFAEMEIDFELTSLLV